MTPEQKEVVENYREIVQETTDALSDDVKALRKTIHHEIPKEMKESVNECEKRIETFTDLHSRTMTKKVNGYAPLLMNLSVVGNVIVLFFAALILVVNWEYRLSPQQEAEIAGKEASKTVLKQIPDLWEISRDLQNATDKMQAGTNLLQNDHYNIMELQQELKELLWSKFGYTWPKDPDKRFRTSPKKEDDDTSPSPDSPYVDPY